MSAFLLRNARSQFSGIARLPQAVLGMLAGVALLLSPDSGLAQGAPPAVKPAAKKKDEKAPKVKVERRGGRKVYRITTGFVIEGRIQKPNAFYVLQRSQINYDWTKLKKDFTPRILNAVRKSPF